MKPYEENIDSKSNYYIYSPSMNAKEMLLYPLQCGEFTYLPNYRLIRDSFDSYLLLYIKKGNLTLTYEGETTLATSDDFIFIDCYKLHEYHTTTGCECLWCHFDGITAKAFYSAVTTKLTNVFHIPDAYQIITKMQLIIDTFAQGKTVREPMLAKYLNDIMTAFLLYSPTASQQHNPIGIAEDTITYINENFSQNITIAQLADRIGISQYHFIRTFKKETGLTPHEYIINTRIATAKYLLKNTKLPIKEIGFQTGFSCESVFCSAFKKHQDMTPVQYRTLLED